MRALISRVGPLSGSAGSALVFTGLMLGNGATAELSPADAPSTIATAFDANRGGVRLGVALALAGLVLTIAFVAYLSRAVRAAPDGGWLGSVVLGGGMVAVAGVTIHLALLVASTNSSIVAAPETARTLLVLQWEYGGVLAPAWAALVGGAGVAAIRSPLGGRATRIVSWLGVPLAGVLDLSGFFGGFFVVLALLWLGALAASLVVAPSRAEPALAPA